MGSTTTLLRRHFCSPSDPFTSSVAKTLVTTPDLDHLISTFRSLSSTSPHFRRKPHLYKTVISRLLAAGRRDDVADLLSEQTLTPSITHPPFAARLIFLYGKASMPGQALDTFLRLPSLGCPASVFPFNSLLAALSACGEHEKVVELFRDVPSKNPEMVPDERSYHEVISAECERSDLSAAMGLLEEAVEAGKVAPRTFALLIEAFYGAGKPEDAERVWGMAKAGSRVPAVECFNAKVRAFVRDGKLSEAAEVVGVMRDCGVVPDGHTYTALITGHCKAGDLKGARKVFKEMCRRNCEPIKTTYEALVPRLCEIGELGVALQYCGNAIRWRFPLPARVLQMVVDGLVERSLTKKARSLVKSALESNKYSSDELRMPVDVVESGTSEVDDTLSAPDQVVDTPSSPDQGDSVLSAPDQDDSTPSAPNQDDSTPSAPDQGESVPSAPDLGDPLPIK